MSFERVQIGDATIYTGDALAVLRTLPAESVQCCVTSPPYYGLRDYGHDGQIGLEPTPEQYVERLVEVFREVRRVLRDDGTLWLNLGDSYAGGNTSGKWREGCARADGEVRADGNSRRNRNGNGAVQGVKPKELIGIPWSVAQSLRDPYYTGRMKQERDRAWIAAMIDGEGTICGFHHLRADNGSPRTGAHITITNSSVPLLEEAHRIWPTSRSEHQRAGAGHLGKRATFRWIVHGAENKMQFLREVYPYLIAKKRQALVAYNLLLMFADAKSVGHSAGRDAARDKRAFLVSLLSDLNQCRPVDMPSWLVEPPSVFQPGYYLRQDVIWAKPNPMPESVRDRCTKAHEYLFMLTKSARYFYDADAIKVDARYPGDNRAERTDNRKLVDPFCFDGGSRSKTGNPTAETVNRRSVWTVATQPYAEAHFATFPPALIEPCILAGSRHGDTVLDPFNGSGTSGDVALLLGRRYVGIELNPQYVELTRRRLRGKPMALPFAMELAA